MRSKPEPFEDWPIETLRQARDIEDCTDEASFTRWR